MSSPERPLLSPSPSYLFRFFSPLIPSSSPLSCPLYPSFLSLSLPLPSLPLFTSPLPHPLYNFQLSPSLSLLSLSPSLPLPSPLYLQLPSLLLFTIPFSPPHTSSILLPFSLPLSLLRPPSPVKRVLNMYFSLYGRNTRILRGPKEEKIYKSNGKK